MRVPELSEPCIISSEFVLNRKSKHRAAHRSLKLELCCTGKNLEEQNCMALQLSSATLCDSRSFKLQAESLAAVNVSRTKRTSLVVDYHTVNKKIKKKENLDFTGCNRRARSADA